MTDKELIKNYKDTFKMAKESQSEKAKKIYVNAFNAFDKKLNKDLDAYITSLNTRPVAIQMEITRIKKVLNALRYRLDVRDKMVSDYKQILGYKPKKLTKIPIEKEYTNLKSTLSNLTKADGIIKDLIISGKEIRKIKRSNTVFKNEKAAKAKIDKLIKRRVELIDLLKKSPEIMDDLYDFAIKAPFNEENGYINYLIVKSDPKGILKKDEK